MGERNDGANGAPSRRRLLRNMGAGAMGLAGAALDAARQLTVPDGLICVTGSLFLAAEARALVLGGREEPAPVRVAM